MSSIKVMVIKRCEKADLSAINLIALDKTHKHLKIKKPVVFFFINDTQMLEINQNSLGHDTYTDTITFDYEEDEDIEQNEVVVSWERLEENAITFRTSFTEEVHRVCIHSLLHLAGQKDKTKDEKEKMRSLEDKFLNLYCST
jgi:probable rRNA maturation factor